MQVVPAGFTAEEKDMVQKIAHSLLVSWHKQFVPSNRTFTVGVSIIGGNDVIGANPGALGSPGNYKYSDETQYVMSMAWERGLNVPTGGLNKAMAEAKLYNGATGTDKGRFTPRYLGGRSELYTAVLPRRPAIINAGFNYDGNDKMIPQFTGLFDKQPALSVRDKTISLSMADYVDFFQNRFLDQTVMYTSVYTNTLLENMFSQLGMSTAQYNIDQGINLIPFALFNKGTRFSDAIQKLAEAENAQFYQDEQGIFRFENRQHWDDTPYNQVQRVINTSQVIDSGVPNEDHLINVVEVKSQSRAKQPLQIVMNFSQPTLINGDSSIELFFSYQDPVLQIVTPSLLSSDSYYVANTLSDGSGTDVTNSVSVKSIDNFAQASKIVFQNNSSNAAYLTRVIISGRPAKQIGEIYYRGERDASITAYEERPLTINNEYIADANWARSYAEMILDDFSHIENLQTITVRAIPELQLGDLISWQGHQWRIYDIKTTLDPSAGFIQDLKLLQRTIKSYFRIGISTIGGTDLIAA
jgi:hypothetical protein